MDLNKNVMELITNYLAAHGWLPVVTAVIALASAIAALTPTPKVGSRLAMVYKAIDWLALNVGKAKDKGEEKAE